MAKLKVYDRRPISKRWAIPAHEERRVTIQVGNRAYPYKFCDHCRLPQPTSSFRSDASKPDSLYGTCNSCEDGRRRYNRAIEQGLIPPQPPTVYMAEFPTVICLCGSTRFYKAFDQVALIETLLGNIVLSVGSHRASDSEHGIAQGSLIKADLDELHLRKIDLADEVLVIDIDGYIGASTAAEIAYATALEKPIRYWSREATYITLKKELDNEPQH